MRETVRVIVEIKMRKDKLYALKIEERYKPKNAEVSRRREVGGGSGWGACVYL